MEKDPRVVERLAAEREKENWQFRSFLKRLSPRRLAEVNRLAEKLGREAEAHMDCQTCGACCGSHHAPVEPAEIERLAGRLGLPVLEFHRCHLEEDDDGELALKAPCIFLEGTRCSVYEDRPESCRGYPYVGGAVAPRMIGIIERAGTCPIVYEMLEGLKREMRFIPFR